MKAYTFPADGSGKMTESAVARLDRRRRPDRPRRAHRMVAEADDTLMEKFFDAGTLTQEELTAA